MKSVSVRRKPLQKLCFFFSCLLCVLLLVSCFSLPALGAEEAENVPLPETPEAAEQQPGEASTELPEAPDFGDELPENSSLPLETEEPGEAEAPETVTLTFKLGSFGTETVLVEKGQYPQLPEAPQLPAARFAGWFDKNGQLVYPDSFPAEEDAVYIARWERQVSELLNTDTHFAYIRGHENGMFKPDAGVTRAEAAQMFYALLRERGWEKKSFSDVNGQWYAEAVGVMAGLGILQGYPDGTFRPGKKITRAEFVTIAVSCDALAEGELSFSDVSKSSWAAPYIATAATKGWISGFHDGTFRPEKGITRAEAVTVLNKMLGRCPDETVREKTDAKNFYDLFPEHWAYENILEAATDHSHVSYGVSGEIWTDYTQDTEYPEKSRWVKDGSTLYYLDASTRKFLRGEQTIDGKKYLFRSDTGAAYTGFRKNGSWRRYYKNGLMVEDISGLGVVKGPYFIKVYKNSNYLIIFAKDSSGAYNTPVRAMRTSCGYGTPTGTFYTPDRYRWLQMVGDTWAQWCTQIQGNYLFHSVPNWTQSNMDLEVDEYNHLGETRSLGCIRLNCRDAKWIFDNCALGTKVQITTSEGSGPLKKPAGLQIPSWHSWDPTDPTAAWRCRQNGCH